ncbi:protein FAM114A2 [Neocloeon triangulifer]|uniref:protein FAM114A2 n=1 Tax=Neocloeon triangulifer TaxID=2078957 RepID=UPI00286F11B6|nr:protein FAM114A2 [Neocloeon triangulifer]
MATSDSEDFESADEGFDTEDSPKENPEPLGSANADQKQTSQNDAKPPVAEEKVVEPDDEPGWEPEDLDDDILEAITDEDSVNDSTIAVDRLKIEESLPVEPQPKAEEFSNQKIPAGDKVNEDKVEDKVEQKPINEETEETLPKGRRPRPIREAKNVTKLASGGPKKLGSKLPASSKPDFEASKSTDEILEPKVETVVGKIESQEDRVEDKPEVLSVLDKLSSAAEESQQSSGWGSWGGWGTSLLSTATSSVSSLGSHVISTVIDTVESGLGAPDPEEIAKEQLAEAVKEPLDEGPKFEAVDESSKPEDGGSFPLGSWISGVSQFGKIVESTGSKVLSGGLDTLENIGKKTMQVLQDGDPGLKKKRALFQQEKPVLSQALREAKELADQEEKAVEEKVAARKVHFETLFDDFQGLVHLEALEMLSRQCEMKLQSSLLKLSGAELKEAHEKLVAVRDESILPSTDDVDEPDGDIAEAVKENINALPVKVTSEKILKIWNLLQQTSAPSKPLNEDYAHCISTLAEMTSACVEIFHRVGELLTVNESRDPLKEADALQKLTINLIFLLERTATLLCDRLNQTHGDDAQPIITKVFLEASNSSTYIQDAFQLLMPVLQQAALP